MSLQVEIEKSFSKDHNLRPKNKTVIHSAADSGAEPPVGSESVIPLPHFLLLDVPLTINHPYWPKRGK